MVDQCKSHQVFSELFTCSDDQAAAVSIVFLDVTLFIILLEFNNTSPLFHI